MKIAILYDSKFGNTKEIAEYFSKEMENIGHKTKLFRTKKSKSSNLTKKQSLAVTINFLCSSDRSLRYSSMNNFGLDRSGIHG